MTTEEAINTAKEAVEQQRPLSVSAGRNLLKIVKNDFETLKANLQLFKAEEYQRRAAEIRGAATPEKVEEVRAKARETRDKITKLLDEYKDACRQLGLNPGNIYVPAIPDPKDEDMRAKLSAANAEIEHDIAVALRTAEVKFREAERLVLLATVTADAERILSAIPTAQSLLAEAYEQRAQRRQLTAGGER